MLKSLFAYGVLGVFLIPAKCDQISVCVNDTDLRVDCRIPPTPNKISSYHFSLATEGKEFVINTNVSGSSAETRFQGKSYVVELEPKGYRMILEDFKDKLKGSTTYMCKINAQTASVSVEKEKLVKCSAVSLLVKSSCSWIFCLLIFFYHSHS
uniref:Immunoglobulin subtype domain-containing protein n=1 Tax=Monopterus albus TaxID=43700 RepID=A0A3Q3J1H5_MONAL|nr:thy-1 membrane glycoprotein [Monopterus albus]